jgi:hypothetical protein
MFLVKLKDKFENILFSTCQDEEMDILKDAIKEENCIILEETRISGITEEFFNYHFPINSLNYNLVSVKRITDNKENEIMNMIMTSKQIDEMYNYLPSTDYKITQIIPFHDEIYKYIKKQKDNKSSTDFKAKMEELKKMLKNDEISYEEVLKDLKVKIKESISELKNQNNVPDDILKVMFANICDKIRNNMKDKDMIIPDDLRDRMIEEITSLISEAK